MAFLLDPRLAHQWLHACRLSQSLRAVTLAPVGRRGRMAGEQHTVATLMVCLHGVVRIKLPQGHHDLGVDEALVLPPGLAHEHEPLRPGSASLGMGFLLDYADLEIAIGDSSWLLTIPAQPTRRLIEAACRSETADRQRLRLVREALAELSVETARPLAPMPEPTRRMWMYIRRERLSPISTRDVLRASGLGPTRAKALFAAWFGMTPLRLLRQHRLEYARHLIAQGSPVTEAAAASGFRSRRHLTAACRTVHGMPPSQVR